MTCPCCSGIIPCSYCGTVIRGTADPTQTNSRDVVCNGPGYNFGSTITDSGSPCNSLAASFGACSSISGVPAAYSDCDCMTLEARCQTNDYDLGTDDNGNCCVAYRSTSYTIYYVYVFDNTQCPENPPDPVYGKWRRILTTSPVVVSDCTVQSLGANCTAVCPEIRSCTPPDACLETYDGCECSEFP